MTEVIAEIEVDFPEEKQHTLEIALGACKFALVPGGEKHWVTGTYTFPEDTLPPKIVQRGGNISIQQEFKFRNFDKLFPPKFDLTLGKSKPYGLVVNGGAYEGHYDLGGLPLTRLTMKQGAGKININFSKPNPQRMSRVEIDAGAVALNMENLANANFEEMVISGGASKYRLNFDGKLQEDCSLNISAGMASIELLIPESIAAVITADSTLGDMKVSRQFTWRDGRYWSAAALEGERPLLTIKVNLSIGALKVHVP